jgi:hypothetical protein
MAARKTRPAGAKPDKVLRDAVMLEINVEAPDPKREGRKIKKARLVARALVAGDVPAIKELFDRVDGKVLSALGGNSEDGGITLEELIHMSYAAGRATRVCERIGGDATTGSEIRHDVAADGGASV